MAPPLTPLEWVKTPRQARSQQTLERILDAAECIIVERGIENATVADIARRAESSVGAFYSRFADKEALFRCVFQRFYEQAIATVDDIAEPTRWDDVALGDMLQTILHFLLRVFRDKQLLLRAFAVRSVTDAHVADVGTALGQRIADSMVALLQHRNEPLSHPNPEMAARISVWLILSAVESRVGRAAGLGPSEQIPDDLLARELSQLVKGYLGFSAISPPTKEG